MKQELIAKYTDRLRLISDNEDFIKNSVISLYGEKQLEHMLEFLDNNPKATRENVVEEGVKWINEYKRSRTYAALMGTFVGDALGVPVEFTSRMQRKADPVVDMRAYGTHNQPAGTWSDDSSMALATICWLTDSCDASMLMCDMDYSKLMEEFNAWMREAKYTPHGSVFDMGIATSNAINRFIGGTEATKCGGTGEYDNGNGSLMRIMPASIFFRHELNADVQNASNIYDISAVTHAHPRSKLGCLIYSKIVADMFFYPDMDKKEVITNSLAKLKEYIENKEPNTDILAELKAYERIFDLDTFAKLDESEIMSSGYVVHTLEAAIWCLLNTSSYKECVLKAVNLGDDTDTVGAVAGGLAGLYYGTDSIPSEWINVLARKEWLEELINNMPCA